MIPSTVRIFVCSEPVDMRFGFDRLATIARTKVGEDPCSGSALFVFANRNATRLKLLWFDRNGLCLLYKRLHRAVFEIPLAQGEAAYVRIEARALAELLAGVERPARRARRATTG